MTQHPNSEKAAFLVHACATVPIQEGLFSKPGGHGSVPSLAMVLYLYLKVRLRGRLHTPYRPFHGRRAEGLLRVSPSRPLAHLGHLDAQFVLARILWRNQRPQRGRARQLAEQARDGYAAHGAGQESDLAEVQAWLRTAVRL